MLLPRYISNATCGSLESRETSGGLVDHRDATPVFISMSLFYCVGQHERHSLLRYFRGGALLAVKISFHLAVRKARLGPPSFVVDSVAVLSYTECFEGLIVADNSIDDVFWRTILRSNGWCCRRRRAGICLFSRAGGDRSITCEVELVVLIFGI